MAKKDKHEQKKELILLIGGFLIVFVCIGTVGFLLYNSNVNNVTMPEYAVAFFSSVTTLILGYLFGSKLIGNNS